MKLGFRMSEVEGCHFDNLTQLLNNSESLRIIIKDIYKDLSKLDANYWAFYDIFFVFIRNDISKYASIQYRKCARGRLYSGVTNLEIDSFGILGIRNILNSIIYFLRFLQKLFGFKIGSRRRRKIIWEGNF